MAAILVMWQGPFEQTFVPPSHRRFIWNFTWINPVVSEEKMFKECGRRRWRRPYLSYKLTKWAFGSGEQLKRLNRITLIPIVSSVTGTDIIRRSYLVKYTNFDIIHYNSFWKILCFTFFLYKSIKDQIWPCHKIGHGQLRVIIWTNLVVLEHPMLHTNCQGHRPFGSGEEDFLRFLQNVPYMGMAAILVMWPGPFEQTFVPPSHGVSIWKKDVH